MLSNCVPLSLTRKDTIHVKHLYDTWQKDKNTGHFSADSKRFMVVHNIGRGQELEDMLFDYPITGHYRYYGAVP